LFNKVSRTGEANSKNYAKRKEKKETQNGHPQAQEAFEKEQAQEEVIRVSELSCSCYTHSHFLHINFLRFE
jgi:hypothetical protein